jgi:C4-dicarboxylate-specific signal transduction histidine kinase
MSRASPATLDLSTRELLVRRLRLVLAICILGGVVFGTLDLWNWRPEMLPSFAGKLVGMTLAATAMVVVGQAWARRRAWPIAIIVVSACYVATGVDRILLPDREYQTTALLFVGAAMTTGAIMPWGAIGQLITVAVGAALMVAALLVRDGTVRALASDPAVAVMIAFALSVGVAREVARYRMAHRRELLERRRAEAHVRRLAQRLEHRVAERTAALEEAHQALRQHQAELAHALRLHTMGEMAAALAHEINQPLCAITNYAQGGVQRLRAGTLDPTVLRLAFEAIAREGLRAGQILRGIRNVVQRETAVTDGVDVNALAAEAVRLLEPQARLHGVNLRLNGGSPLPPVQADTTQIEQVMLNLMLNGVEAAASNANAPREVVVATTAHEGAIEVAVSDTGAGIPPPVEQRLFTPFFTTKSHGLGLGLALSRSIVECHGGRLWAVSRPGTGATFRFFLPLTAASPGAATP